MRDNRPVDPTNDPATILFDFNATLVWNQDNGAWIRAAREHAGRAAVPADPGEGKPRGLQEGLGKVWVLARRRDPTCSWDLSPSGHRLAFTTVLTKDLGCSESLATALYDVMPDQWQLYDDAIDVLTSLRWAGKNLGIVSNIGFDIRPRLEELGVLPLFSSVVLSFEAKVAKPNPEIFQIALREMKSEASSTFMVGDTWDQDGAAATIGISTLILPVKDRPCKGLKTIMNICSL